MALARRRRRRNWGSRHDGLPTSKCNDVPVRKIGVKIGSSNNLLASTSSR